MRECPRCETCYEDDVETCPQDQANTKHTLPGPRLLASRYLLEKRLEALVVGQREDGSWPDRHNLPQWQPIQTIWTLKTLHDHGRLSS